MCAAHKIDIATQDTRLHIVRADHMVRHQQELLIVCPGIVFADDRCQLRNAPSRRVALQNEVQHGHEMALPTPKAPMQIARLARATVHGTAHETQRVVKAGLQLWGHDIVTERLFRTVHTLGEPQNEVTPLHLLRDVDEFFDQRHRIFCLYGTWLCAADAMWSRMAREMDPIGYARPD